MLTFKDYQQNEETMSSSETYKRLAVKHLRDSMNKNNTQKQVGSTK